MFAHLITSTDSLSSTYFYTISANDNGIDLWADIVTDNGGSAPSQNNIQVTIESGVEIGAVGNTLSTNYAIDVDENFAGKTLTIINNGYVGGFGGDGGEYDTDLILSDGQNGGCAINFDANDSSFSVNLINNGTIAGGGGGGAGNSGTTSEPGFTFYSDGGGGAGLPAGSAGGGYTPSESTGGASDGTRDSGGIASLGVSPDDGPGGNGGNPGAAGQNAGGTGGNGGPPYQALNGATVNYSEGESGQLLGSQIT